VSRRTIYKAAGSTEVRELLQSILTLELLRPSRTLWLVSPWLSDIPVLDNAAGGYSCIEPSWPLSSVPLSSVLIALALRGAMVRVQTRADVSEAVVQKLRRRASLERASLEIQDVGSTLHSKGIAGDGYLLSGSMNLTYNGVEVLDELVHFDTDRALVDQAHVAFTSQWERSRHP
jgi:hypothetical protein